MSIAKKFSSNNSFYVSVVLYAIYIFLINWSTAAQRMGSSSLHELFMAVANIVLIACCIFILHKFFSDFDSYVKKNRFTFFSILVICFMAVAINSISIVLPLILGFIAINTDNKKTAKLIVKALVILLIVSSIFSLLGLTGGDYISKPLFGDDSYYVEVMSAFGMANPNSVMIVFINVIALTLYLCRTQKQTLYATIGFTVSTILIANETGSTTGLLMGLSTIVLINLARSRKRVAKMFRRVTPWAFLIFTFASFYIATSFGAAASIPNPVNEALTTRPYMWNLRIENNSYLNIYGNNDRYEADGGAGGAVYALDNMIIYILVQYGIIVYLIFFYVIRLGSKKISDPALLVYVFIVCALMVVERIYLCSFILIFLLKEITEYHLINNKKNGDIGYARIQ